MTADRPGARGLAVLALLGLLPWTVLLDPGGVQVVALWGLAVPATGHVVSLPRYLFVLTAGLPDRLLAWPASALLYLAGWAAAAAERLGRGDARLSAGLLGLAALAHLGFAVGLARLGGATVLPVGPALVGGAVWWIYGRTLRAMTRER